MFKEIDIDGSGTIDYTEFVMATMNEKNILSSPISGKT
jgi:Ca2+-binding EF-hand superfamily protein